MTFIIGLTGSIGMGKSTTARMFGEFGIPAWDADAAVARLYGPGGSAVPLIETAFPGTTDQAVDRQALRNLIARDPAVLTRLEEIVHPLVAKDRDAFLAQPTSDIVVLDIPLLFETGLDAICDLVVVVSAPADVQRERVLSRGLSEAEFQGLLARQMPDSEKRARADVVIETLTLEAAREAVQALVTEIREGKYA